MLENAELENEKMRNEELAAQWLYSNSSFLIFNSSLT